MYTVYTLFFFLGQVSGKLVNSDSKVLSNRKKSYNPVLNPGGFPGRF